MRKYYKRILPQDLSNLKKKCNKCGTFLTNENWSLSTALHYVNICKKCNSIYHNRKNKEYEYNGEGFRKRNQKLKLEVLNHYSNGTLKCACCGENIYEFLSIDHINNDGAEHRRNNSYVKSNLYKWLIDNNFPEGFQVLCMNCNFGKRINKGICPHKEITIIEGDSIG